MYNIVSAWILEVCDTYHLQRQTMLLSLSYVQRYLAQSTLITEPSKLQLLAATALLIAYKIEESTKPMTFSFLVHVTGSHTYTPKQFQCMENQILNDLHFRISTPTSLVFIERYITTSCVHDDVSPDRQETLGHLAHFFLECAATTTQLFCCLPSLVAGAAVALSRATLHLSVWVRPIEYRYDSMIQPYWC